MNQGRALYALQYIDECRFIHVEIAVFQLTEYEYHRCHNIDKKGLLSQRPGQKLKLQSFDASLN